jgi:hypothetical protein
MGVEFLCLGVIPPITALHMHGFHKSQALPKDQSQDSYR